MQPRKTINENKHNSELQMKPPKNDPYIKTKRRLDYEVTMTSQLKHLTHLLKTIQAFPSFHLVH